jgi:hypothetical protein
VQSLQGVLDAPRLGRAVSRHGMMLFDEFKRPAASGLHRRVAAVQPQPLTA